jgi:hypothetical protein
MMRRATTIADRKRRERKKRGKRKQTTFEAAGFVGSWGKDTS